MRALSRVTMGDLRDVIRVPIAPPAVPGVHPGSQQTIRICVTGH